MRGNVNEDHLEMVDACPQTFDPDQFASQSCFQGRYGLFVIYKIMTIFNLFIIIIGHFNHCQTIYVVATSSLIPQELWWTVTSSDLRSCSTRLPWKHGKYTENWRMLSSPGLGKRSDWGGTPYISTWMEMSAAVMSSKFSVDFLYLNQCCTLSFWFITILIWNSLLINSLH